MIAWALIAAMWPRQCCSVVVIVMLAFFPSEVRWRKHADFNSHLQDWGLWSAYKVATDYGRDAPRPPRVVIGPVASGSAVLADGEVVHEIKAQHRDLIGIEMEVYGMYSAAYSASQPQPLAFALKAVCDFADPNKGDNHQRYAAYTSANVLRLLMERFGLRLLNPT